MTPYPDSPEEWSAIVGTIMALLIVWRKYRSERKFAMEICPAHLSMTDRMDKSETDRGQIKATLGEHGQQIAVTVALMRELKEDVAENRRIVSEKLSHIDASLQRIAIDVAIGKR